MKKFLKVLLRIFEVLLIIFTVCVMIFTIVSVSTVEKDDRSILGYRMYIVLSDSMQDTFEVGDMIVSGPVDVNELKPGDIISFKSSDPSNYGTVVTHKIREISTTDGELSFVTYGTTTGANDAYPALASDVLGEYSFRLPKMGYVFEFLKTPLGYFTIIFIPFFLLLLVQGVRFFKLMARYKTEQREVLEKQKDEIEQQRLINQKMQMELELLRNRVDGNAYSGYGGGYDPQIDGYRGNNMPQNMPPVYPEQQRYYDERYTGYDNGYDGYANKPSEYNDGYNEYDNYQNW